MVPTCSSSTCSATRRVASEALLRERQDAGATPARLVPVLRARVTAVRGREVNLENFSDVRGRGSLAREYTITYRDHLESNEHIVQGRFLEAGTGRRPPRSRPKSPSRKASTSASTFYVGDEMRFDVLGRQVLARVTSIRHVEWGDARSGGFMFVFRPGRVCRRAAHLHRVRESARRSDRSREGSRTTSRRDIRTSPPSMDAKSSRVSRRSSTTRCWAFPLSAVSRC